MEAQFTLVDGGVPADDSELATAVEEDRAGWGGLDGRAWNLTWTTCIRCYPFLILLTYPLSLPGLAEELVQI